MLKKFISDKNGGMFIAFAIALPIILIILAVAVDLNKVQGKYQGVVGATDAAAGSLSELLRRSSLEDKLYTNAESRAFALNVFKTNIKTDQKKVILIEDSFTVDTSGKDAIVSACIIVKPNSLAAAGGMSKESQVCSESAAPILCGEGLEWDGAKCAPDCNDPAVKNLTYEIHSVLPNAQDGLQDHTFFYNVKKTERLRIFVGTNFQDTNEGSTGYAGGINKYTRPCPHGCFVNEDAAERLRGTTIASSHYKNKGNRHISNGVNTAYNPSAYKEEGKPTGAASMVALYEPGRKVKENVKITGAGGSYITANLRSCSEEDELPTTYDFNVYKYTYVGFTQKFFTDKQDRSSGVCSYTTCPGFFFTKRSLGNHATSSAGSCKRIKSGKGQPSGWDCKVKNYKIGKPW